MSSRRPWSFSLWALMQIVLAAAVVENVPMLTDWYLGEEACLRLALLFFCISRVRQAWRQRKQPAERIEWCLPPARFLATWITAALTIGAAAPTLGLFNFIFWLGPPIWWRLPLSTETRKPPTIAVNRPRSGVTPEAMAIAMESGNATIATVNPAIASARNR